MKTETTEFFKLARKQTKQPEKIGKIEAWQNRAYAGKHQKDKRTKRDESKLF